MHRDREMSITHITLLYKHDQNLWWDGRFSIIMWVSLANIFTLLSLTVSLIYEKHGESGLDQLLLFLI